MPLGVILKNENKRDEMVDIMTHLHQYVPSVKYDEMKVISTGEHILEEEAGWWGSTNSCKGKICY